MNIAIKLLQCIGLKKYVGRKKSDLLAGTLEVHLKEYEMLRCSIEQALSMQHQLTNYAIAITAASGSLFFIGEPSLANQVPILLLVISFILTFICFAILDLGYSIQNTSTYIQKILKPKIQKLIGNDDIFEYIVLEWEEHDVKVTGRLAIRGITSMGKYAVAAIPSIGMIVAFIVIKANTTWTIYEKVFYWLAVFAVVLLVIVAILNIVHLLKRGPKEIIVTEGETALTPTNNPGEKSA